MCVFIVNAFSNVKVLKLWANYELNKWFSSSFIGFRSLSIAFENPLVKCFTVLGVSGNDPIQAYVRAYMYFLLVLYQAYVYQCWTGTWWRVRDIDCSVFLCRCLTSSYRYSLTPSQSVSLISPFLCTIARYTSPLSLALPPPPHRR